MKVYLEKGRVATSHTESDWDLENGILTLNGLKAIDSCPELAQASTAQAYKLPIKAEIHYRPAIYSGSLTLSATIGIKYVCCMTGQYMRAPDNSDDWSPEQYQQISKKIAKAIHKHPRYCLVAPRIRAVKLRRQFRR
jgi:hypothetical protein